MDSPGDMGEAFLYVNVPDDPQIGSEVMYLPPISSIEAAYYTNLSELPTIVMGYRNNFIIDLGTTLKISLTMKRINPLDYDDDSRDVGRWSNGKWYRHLEDILDYWQNFGRDSSNNLTGGFQFNYTPSDTSLYPPINRNVFLNGSLAVQYSTQYMVVQMNLTVARMQESTSVYRYVTLICHAGSAFPNVEDYTVEVLADVNISVPNPTDWGPLGYTLRGWATSADGSMEYSVDDVVMWSYREEPYELWAVWGGPKIVKYWSDPVAGETYSPSQDWTEEQDAEDPISYVRVIIVGGGGGAGGAAWTPLGGSSTAGGAGGGAECHYSEWTASRTTSYNITVGKGGSKGYEAGINIVADTGGNGTDGEPSSVSASNGFQHTSQAGAGGQGGQYRVGMADLVEASGGQTVYAGGSTGINGTWEMGQAGSTASPNVQDNAGYGAINNDSAHRSGGAGGGASNCNYSFYLSGTTYDFISHGGDAFDSTREGGRQEPAYGGGGGSSQWQSGGDTNYAQDGASGLVVLVFY